MEMVDDVMLRLLEERARNSADTTELASTDVLTLIGEIRRLRHIEALVNPITDRAIAYSNKYGGVFPRDTRDVAMLYVITDAERLRAEIERQEAEIAALRGVINDIERAVINETVNPPKLQSWIVHRIHEGVAALNTKPDAAPAPAEIRKPMPKAEVVTHVDTVANRVFLTYGSDDARAWIEQSAPQFGVLFHEEHRRTFVVNVFATHNASEVAEYLRQMQD